MKTQDRAYGDLVTPLGMQFKQDDTSGDLAVTDLTGMTIKVFVVDSQGKNVVAETETGVTVVDEANGKITYDFQTALTPGIYYVYGRAWSLGQRDTFPAVEKQMRVVIYYSGEDS